MCPPDSQTSALPTGLARQVQAPGKSLLPHSGAGTTLVQKARGDGAAPALWAWQSHGGVKASLEGAVASGGQHLACHLLWEKLGPRAAGRQKGWRLWARRSRLQHGLGGAERLHLRLHLRLRVAPLGAEPQEEEETCRRKSGQWAHIRSTGPTQDLGTSLAQVTWASQRRTSNSQTPLLLAARRDRA